MSHSIKAFLVSDITASATIVAQERSGREGFYAYNLGAGTVYLGNSAVTTSTGWPLAPGGDFSEFQSRDPWYAIAASGTVKLLTIEMI